MVAGREPPADFEGPTGGHQPWHRQRWPWIALAVAAVVVAAGVAGTKGTPPKTTAAHHDHASGAVSTTTAPSFVMTSSTTLPATTTSAATTTSNPAAGSPTSSTTAGTTWTDARVKVTGCTDSQVTGVITNTGSITNTYIISATDDSGSFELGDGTAEVVNLAPHQSTSWTAPVQFSNTPTGPVSCSVDDVLANY